MIPAWFVTFLVFGQLATGPESRPEDVVMLDDYGPCGLTSLYAVCKIRQVPVEWERLKELVGPTASDGSHSFADLSRAAATLGMHPVGLHVTRQTLRDLPMPVIVQVYDPPDLEKRGHLLVLLRPEPDGVSLLDPPYPVYFLAEARFAHAWTGNVLVFARDETEAKRIRESAIVSQTSRPLMWIAAALGLVAGLVFTSRSWLPTLGGWTAAALGRIRGRIQPVLAGSALLACVGVGYWFLAAHSVATPAQCVFDRPVIDLGELRPGQTKYTVPIRNAGTAPLRISKVVSTCTCAVVQAPEVIEAGQTDVLQVALNIPEGPAGARITIESNDLEGPKTLSLHWYGTATAKLIPYKVEAESVPGGQPYERTVRVVYPGGKSALVPRLDRCECDSPLVDVRAGKNDPLAARFARSGLLTQVLGEQELHVKVRAPAEPGFFVAKCKLHLKYGEIATTLDLPIRLEFVAGELRPEVGAVVFSAARAQELQGQERLVRVRDAAPGSELVVQDAPPWLECHVVQKAEEGPAIRLKVVKHPPGPLVQHTLHIKYAQGTGSPTPHRVSVYAPSP